MNNSEQIPELTKLFNEFQIQVQIQKPSNLIEFAAEYFTKLANKKTPLNQDENKNIYDDEKFSSEEENYEDDVMEDEMSTIKRMQSSQVPRKSIICEPFDPSSIDNETFEKNRKIFPKTPKQMDKIAEIMKTIFIFNCLEEEQIEKVMQSMFLMEVLQGDVVIKENDPGNNFYIVDYGKFTAANKMKTVLERYDGEGFFGELALLYNCPRAATVTADTDGGLWAIDRITFRQLILKSAYQKRQRFLEFIKSFSILNELSPYDQCNLADALKTKIVTNERIICEGETGDRMYFIEEGEALVTVLNKDGVEEEKNRLHSGDYFGEVALLAKIPRIASVYAVGTIKLAELDVNSYNRLMGPCIDRMRSNFTNYQTQLKTILTKNQFQELFHDLITNQEPIST